MATTNRERQFLIKLKEEWVSKEEAIWRLRDVRIKLKEQQVPTVEETEVVEKPTIWTQAKEIVKWALISPVTTTIWAVKWAVEWFEEAPAVFWPEWWAARMEARWIEKQKEAAETKILTDRLWELEKEMFEIQQIPAWAGTIEDVERSREIRKEQEEIQAQLPTIPWPLQEWIWALQEFSAPVSWPIWASFWKLFGGLLWTAKWTITPEQQEAFWEVIQSAIETGQDIDKLWEEKLWTAWKVAKEAVWATFEIVEPLLEIIWVWEAAKLLKQWFTTWVKETVKEVVEPTKGLALWKDLPEKIIASVQKINPSKRQEFVKITKWKSPEEWLNERGIIQDREDTIAILWQRWLDAKNEIDTWITQLWWKFKDKNVSTMLKQSLEEATETWDDIRKKLLKKFTELDNKEWLTPNQIITIKRDFEKNVTLDYLRENLSKKAKTAKNLDSKVREFLISKAEEAWFWNFRDLSRELQQSRFLADEIAWKLTGQQANNLFGFTDNLLVAWWIIEPSILLWLWIKKTLWSEAVKAAAARWLKKAFWEAPKIWAPKAPLKKIELKEKLRKKRED